MMKDGNFLIIKSKYNFNFNNLHKSVELLFGIIIKKMN